MCRQFLRWLVVSGAALLVGAGGPSSAKPAVDLLQTGSTLEGEFPPGSAAEAGREFSIEPEAKGLLVIQARSVDLDLSLQLFKVVSKRERTLVIAADEGGLFTDPQLTFTAEAGARYRLLVRANSGALGGRFSLQLGTGPITELKPEERQTQEAKYLEEVISRAEARQDSLRLAAALTRKGSFFIGNRTPDQGRALLERALAIYEKVSGPDAPPIITPLRYLTELELSAGAYPKSRALIQRLLRLVERHHGPSSLEIAEVFQLAASIEFATGAFPEALAFSNKELVIRRAQQGPNHPDTVEALSSVGGAQRGIGNLAEARTHLQEALALAEANPEFPPLRLTPVLNNLAVVLKDLGQFAQARPYYEKALAIREKNLAPDHLQVAISLNNLANLFRVLGMPQEARPLFERALKIRETKLPADHTLVAQSLNNLAGLLMNMGAFKESKALYERALKIRETKFGPDHPQVASIQHSLGDLNATQGDFEKAVPYYEKALSIRLAEVQKHPGTETPDLALTLTNLCRTRALLGKPDLGLPLCRQALEIAEKKMGSDSPFSAVVIDNMARSLIEQGEMASAKPLILRALDIRQRKLGPTHIAVAQSLRALALVEWGDREILRAADFALASDAIGRDQARIQLRSMAESEALAGSPYLDRSIAVFLSLVALHPDQPADILRRGFEAFSSGRSLVLEERSFRHAAGGPSAAPEIREKYLAFQRANQRLSNLAMRGPQEESAESYQKMVREAREQSGLAERELASLRPQLGQTIDGATISYPAILAALPPKSALVSFAVFRQNRPLGLPPSKKNAEGGPESAFLAFVITPGASAPRIVSLGPSGPIEAAITRWREEILAEASSKRPVAEALSRYRRAAGDLRKSIWDPLQPLLAGIEQVFLVPDAALATVSFPTLTRPDGRFLLESGPLIHILEHERDILQLNAAPPAGSGRLLALGGADFDDATLYSALTPRTDLETGKIAPAAALRAPAADCDWSHLKFEPLPGSTEEVAGIMEIWKERYKDAAGGTAVTALLGHAANETTLKAAAPGTEVLHLATHAFVLGPDCRETEPGRRGMGGLAVVGSPDGNPLLNDTDPMLHSGLALAGANHHKDALGEEDDGILTSAEAAMIDLEGVRWVVLSACDSGRGALRAGEGVLGLRRAFRVAGARTVIMSLWPVEDRAARDWMVALYRKGLDGRLRTAAAVREASRTVLTDRRRRGLSIHPFYWGAFIAAGDPR